MHERTNTHAHTHTHARKYESKGCSKKALFTTGNQRLPSLAAARSLVRSSGKETRQTEKPNTTKRLVSSLPPSLSLSLKRTRADTVLSFVFFVARESTRWTSFLAAKREQSLTCSLAKQQQQRERFTSHASRLRLSVCCLPCWWVQLCLFR